MNFIRKNILPGLIILATGTILAVFLYSNLAKARQPDTTTDRSSNPIASDRTAPFYLYFGYGSINSDTDTLNSQVTVNLTGDGFEFIPDGFSDLYFGLADRSDSTNPPDSQPCDSSFSGPAYAISSTLATSTSLTYGLQTSRQLSSPGGSSSPSTLKGKNTGCIKVKMKVKSGAVPGQTATITYDPDSANSPSYQEANRPGKKNFILKVGNPANSIPLPSIIAIANVTSGTCVSVQLNSPTTCEYPLALDTNNSYALPSSGIVATVPGSTASPACTIVNNNSSNAKLSCTNVPTTGSTVGTKQVFTSLGLTPTANLVITAAPIVPTTITVANLTTGTCTLVQLNSPTTCEYPLALDTNNSYALPSSGIVATVPGSTASPACTIVNNNSSNAKLSCTNVPTTGSTVGTKQVFTSLGLTPTANLVITASSSTSTTGSTTSTSGTTTSTTGSTTSTTATTSTTSTSSTTGATSASSTTSTSGSTTSATSTAAITTPIVSTGSTTITGNANDVKTIAAPLTGISNFEVALSDQVSNGSVSYSLLDNTGSCTNSVSGTRRLANSFTYNFDKTKIKNIKVTFALPNSVTNIKAFSCSSPGVETTIQSLGNNQYSATIPAASTFLVTADTVTTTASTPRTGGIEILVALVGVTGLFGAAYLSYRSQKRIHSVDVVDKN